MAERFANLNRLLELRDEGIGPRGRRQQGPIERSQPTGWTAKHGEISVQELEFSNGYVVMALQIPGQKGIIKGPEAALGLLEAIKSGEAEACISEWLEHVSKGLKGVQAGRHTEERRGAPHELPAETRKETAEERREIDSLKADVADIKSAMADIMGFIQQQTKPEQPRQ